MTRSEVLFIGLEAPRHRRGGLNNYLAALRQFLGDEGTQSSVVWMAADESAGEIIIPVNSKLHGRLRLVAKAIRQSGAKVIDVHFAAYAAWAILKGDCRGRKVVVHFQGPWAQESAVNGDGRISVFLKSRLEGFVLRRADVVVVLSNSFRRVAIQKYAVAPSRIVVRAPGVRPPVERDRSQLRLQLGIEPEEVLLVTVRRLVARMGLLEFVLNFAQWRRGNERLVIVGDGPQRPELDRCIQENGFSGFVSLVGSLDDESRDNWLTAADVVVVPSRFHEGYGLVVLESLACGTPVIAAKCDGLVDAVRGLVGAVCIDVDDATQWRNGVDDFVHNIEARVAAHNESAKFSWSSVAQWHQSLYDAPRRDPPRQVVFLDHTAQLSGGELALSRMLDKFPQADFSPHVIVFSQGPLLERLDELGISAEVLILDPGVATARRGNLIADGFFTTLVKTGRHACRLRVVLHRRKAVIVHTNSLKALVVGLLVSFASPFRVVTHIRDTWAPPYLRRPVVWALRVLVRLRSDLVIANSRHTGQLVSRSFVVLPSPVGPEFFAVAPRERESTSHAALIGRLAPWKGQDFAIRALAELNDEGVVLHIAGEALFGEDEYASSLIELARSEGVGDRVLFHGFVENVPQFLEDMDVVLLASQSPEPFGNVITEAMAAGRTVIVPHEGGVSEFVSDQINGFVYPPRDLQGLVDQWRLAMTDVGEMTRRSDRGRRDAHAFDAEAIAQRLVDEYLEILR